MAGVCKLDIKETSEELKTLLAEQKTAINFQKVQALYLFKIGQVTTVQDLALTVGRNRVTVQHWLRKYREQGIAGLLRVRHSGGRKPAIPPEAIAGLQQRLNDSQRKFESYGEIHRWLQQEYGVIADYKTVYATVRYKLKVKLKCHRR
ncbi:MAG: helix-turn-helix domain-containing protein [Symploca sp. SIO3C6]|uniref:Helix-turn-helix domain-containing protein n=1 Tax=Symploca sp. SIO1C4 TaxID=2607765 RepID=A0A6B3N0G7_9CYAN|nr:helix-turn-helix domain-containing protein [Symploca sp. SIO3C6]NER26589.1 helix-turn-helix domain-containing protein [Symploca sp. SIO1C4]NET03167.1 helix-turn-helix domain-containing protein [Symploca sp. SIO2B6]